jgi:hypothetical protein
MLLLKPKGPEDMLLTNGLSRPPGMPGRPLAQKLPNEPNVTRIPQKQSRFLFPDEAKFEPKSDPPRWPDGPET